jgi:hypothetical protein
MRFIDRLGNVSRARRSVSGTASVQDEEVKSHVKLAEVLRGLLRRITELEAKTPKEATEFEVDLVSAGDIVTLSHKYGVPVRYYVVTWTRLSNPASAFPANPPNFVMQSTSDINNLVLKGTVSGRAIIRVEPAQSGIGF